MKFALIGNFNPWRVALLSLAAFPALFQPHAAQAGNGVWTNLSGGSWTNVLNWSAGTVADGASATADFSTLSIPTNAVVTLDGGRTIGSVIFDDKSTLKHAWSVTTGATGILTLAGGTPAITCNNTSNNISAVIAGSGGLTKAGNGILALLGANTYSGGTTLTAGPLVINSGTALGTGPLAITESVAGGVSNILTVATASAVTLANNISLPAAGGTYVLTKNQTGQLTLAGTISGGGSGVILRTTTDTAGDRATVFEFAGTNTFAGGVQLFRGLVQVDNPAALGTATVYGDGNAAPLGDLTFPTALTFANPVVLQSATTVSNANTVILSGGVSGTGAFTKYGLGRLALAGPSTYTGLTTVNAGTLALGAITLASGSGLNIVGGAVAESAGTLYLNANGSSTVNTVTNAGLLRLTATTNSATSPDIYFNANDIVAQNSTANYGTKISTTVDLGTVQRYIFGLTDHNGVGKYATSSGVDCQFAGPITNTGGLTFIAQDNYTGSNPMEVPFYLSATNTFTGPVEIQRGAVYLGSVGALTNGNVLRFNAAAGNNARFFLYGYNAVVSDLQASGLGNALIADGNLNPGNVGPATLTIIQNNPYTFNGTITDTQSEYNATAGLTLTPTLSLVKTGPAALTLTGTMNYSGATTVKAGKLYINGTASGGGAVNVAGGATLGGNGSLASAVTVSNAAALEAGGGTGTGALTARSLTLGLLAGDAVTLNFTATPAGLTGAFTATNVNGFTNNATVTVNVSGALPATTPVALNLINYTGTAAGAGTYLLGTLPNQGVGYITNNAAAKAIQLVITSVTIPSVTWVGAPTNSWDLLGSNVWLQTGTASPAAYTDSDVAIFDDTAANFMVNLSATVSPVGVVVSNNVNNYTIAWAGQLGGYGGLTKQGAASLTLATSNNYAGSTTIAAGTVILGNPSAISANSANITVNGSLDVNGSSPTLNNLSGSGVVDNMNAGGSPVLTVAGTGAGIFSGAIQNTTGSLELAKTGSGTLTLAGTNTYTGVTVITAGTLQIGTNGNTGNLGAGAVLDNGTLAFNRADTNTVLNDLAGSGAVQQNGAGTLILQGNLTYTGPTTVNAGVLTLPKDHTFDVTTGTTLNIAAGAVARISGTVVNLNVNASSVAVDVTGAGTMQLASTLNSIESFSDLNFGPNNNATADYGCRLACNLDLGSVHRTIYGWSGRNDVTRYGLTGCDCQFGGSIVGSAELTLVGQNSFPPGVNTMEVPFAFNASNSFTGPLEIRRGSLYLGNANALNNGNVLIFDPALGVNSRLFLYGFNAAVSDLQSTAYGAALIADGNNATTTNVGPATLTVTQNNAATFSGNIVDWFTEYVAPTAGSKTPVLSLIKNGPAALTLTGTNTYSGTSVINAGKLYVNYTSTGGGNVTVSTNATLGGNGLINSPVTVQNGGAIETGAGNRIGNLTLKALTLGSVSGDQSVLNLAPGAILNVTNNNGLVLNGGAGSVTVNVGGNFGALGEYPLITYAGTLGGTGFAACQLGSLPAGVLGYLSNNAANASVDLVVTGVTIPRWSGALSAEWSVTPQSAPKNWVLNADGVTPIDYLDGEAVRFDDTAASPNVSLNAASVAPFSVTVSNTAQNYAITGNYGITGTASLTKQGGGALTLGTANTYTGNTTISAGTLALGSALAIPGGPGYGNLTVNGTLDLGGYSPTLNNLTGSGTVDNLTAGGTPVLNLINSAGSIFAGSLQNTSGTLAVNLTGGGSLTLSGTNSLNGSILVNNTTLNVTGKIGSGGVSLAPGGVLSGTGLVSGPATLADGSALVLTANNPLTIGTLALNGKVTVTVAGNVATNAPGTYALLNHGSKTGAGSFALVQIAGLFNSGLSAQLVDTNNQLDLVIQTAALTGTIADVKHVVVFVQENRSFDTYLGTLHGVHGFSDRSILMLTNGNSDLYQPSGSSYELPYHTSVTCINDLDHSWGPTHSAFDNDRNDGWIPNKGAETMAYYNRSDLPYYYALADAYTVLDDYHCSVRASTDPNRVSLMTGMIDPNNQGGGPLIDNTEPANGWGAGWVTYPELLVKAGVSWKIYQQTDNYDDNALAWFAVYKQATAGNPLHDAGNVFSTNVVTQFQNDVASNTLPAVSWIIGPTAQTEHPPYSAQSGEALTKQFLDALAANPSVYSNTVVILTYDENDGFYDHSLPITPPAGTANEFVGGLPIGLGVRVPAIIISPWTRGGHVCSQVFDHTSILRFLETWTGVREPNISNWRRQVTGDLTSAFDFAHPIYDYPSLPATTPINCSSGSTPAVPSPQVVPVQEAGTLTPRSLPYQPNATPLLNAGAGNISLLLTNSGAASVHFLVVPNAYRTDNPTPYDVANNNSATNVYATASTGGKYDLSCYGPNGFQRRFAGNVNADYNQIEALAYLNPVTGGLAVTLANATASAVTFTVTNGYVAGGLSSIVVPAYTTNVVSAGSETNNGLYDLLVTASADNLFLRRFLGRVETNTPASSLVSSKNASNYGDPVTFTATITGYGSPAGTVLFRTNGVVAGAPVPVTGGTAAFTLASLGCSDNLVAAEYSGDPLNPPCTNTLDQVVTNEPPVIVLQPVSLTNNAGTAASFTVGATACTPLSYQWFLGTNQLAGQTNSTLGITSVSPASVGSYHVLVTNASGSTNSLPANLTVIYQAPNVTGGQMILSAGGFQLTFSGPSGQTYQVVATDDLTVPESAWPVVGTGTFGSTNVIFTDLEATNHPGRYYVIKSP